MVFAISLNTRFQIVCLWKALKVLITKEIEASGSFGQWNVRNRKLLSYKEFVFLLSPARLAGGRL